MRVRVLYFAAVREQVGKGAEEIDVPAGVTTLAGLRAHLRARGDAWREALAEGKLLRMALNQDMVPQSVTIKAGDEVAFFPPITGG